MKTKLLTIIVTLLCLTNMDLLAQVDSTIIIVDRSAEYVDYQEKYISKKNHKHKENTSILGKITFLISIKSNYFEKSQIRENGKIYLRKAFKGSNYFPIKFSELKLNKKNLKNYIIKTSQDLHELTSIKDLDDSIGSIPTQDKILYVVFKSDLKKDYITLHRVIMGRIVIEID